MSYRRRSGGKNIPFLAQRQPKKALIFGLIKIKMKTVESAFGVAFLAQKRESQAIPQGDKRIIRGWVIYDWANSVYQLTIASAIFPIYYNQITRTRNDFTVHFFGLPIINTVLYSWAIAAAYLIVGLYFRRCFRVVADYTGRRKSFMKTFTWLGALSCARCFSSIRRTSSWASSPLPWDDGLRRKHRLLQFVPPRHRRARGPGPGQRPGLRHGVSRRRRPSRHEPDRRPAAGAGSASATRCFQRSFRFLSVCVWWIGFSQVTFRRLPKYTFGHAGRGRALFSADTGSFGLSSGRSGGCRD